MGTNSLYEPLMTAVVKRAASDYRRALRSSLLRGEKTASCIELEKFFSSGWGEFLCMGNNYYIMQKIKEEELSKYKKGQTKINGGATSTTDYKGNTIKIAKTICDKAWWVTAIDDAICTVIDYGCSDGVMASFLDDRYPSRFNYIGVDSDIVALEKAKTRRLNPCNYRFVRDIKDIELAWYKPEKTILLLNSTIHEMYDVASPEVARIHLSSLMGHGFRYVAIRDMHELPKECGFNDDFLMDVLQKIQKSSYAKALLEWEGLERYEATNPNFLVEFLLKYFYRKNWKQERDKRYLWAWYDDVLSIANNIGYETVYKENFSIPFLRKKWKTDFDITINAPTHYKVLLKKEKGKNGD